MKNQKIKNKKIKDLDTHIDVIKMFINSYHSTMNIDDINIAIEKRQRLKEQKNNLILQKDRKKKLEQIINESRN